MTRLALLGVALPVGATYLLLQPARRAGAPRLYSIALAIGLGLGLASCTFFVALVLFDGQRAGVMAVDAVLLAAAAAVWWRSRPSPAGRGAPFTPSERVLAVALVVAAAAGVISFLANTLENPHGRWDAWATWNLRARSLAGAGSAWPGVFADPTIHGDYPLLLPATVARLWVYGGSDDSIIPAVVAAAYGAALVLLLYAALAVRRDRSQGLVAALCLLGTPVFLRLVPWQYADVPLAFNLLAVVALLSLHDREPARRDALLLWAGVAAGLAAWTKNEGMVLVLGIVLVRSGLMSMRRVPALRSAAWFVAGLLPPAALVLYFKLTLAPPSPQFNQQREAMLRQLVDPERYAAILSATASELVRGTGPVLLALIVYALLLGRARDQRVRSEAARVAAIIAFAALAYGFTYLTARAELAWLLDHSIDRLVLQLWPSVLFSVLLYTASPTERAAATPSRASAEHSPARPLSRRERRTNRR